MSESFKILSTKNLDKFDLSDLLNNHIEVCAKDFIQTKPIQSNDLINQINSAFNQYIPRIFTSKNAVNAVVELLDIEAEWSIFTIEEKTKNAVLKAFPKTKIMASAPYGAELAQKILALNASSEFIFYCGNKRLDTIPTLLRNAGKIVHEIIVYETILTPEQVQICYNGILFFSPSAVESFFSINSISEQTTFFSIGNTTSQALKQYTNNTIITSKSTSIQGVLDAVSHHFHSKLINTK